jgi:phage-related minor tail protein
VLAGIAQDIARIILRQTVTTPLANLVMGGISSAFGGLFGGGPGDIRGPGGSTSIPFGGPRALGGPVEAGSAYLVGEQGPELFMPGQSGRIIPNGQTGGTVVNQTIQISVGVAQTVRAEIAALMPAIKRQTVDAVADARMRGGSFAAAMGT